MHMKVEQIFRMSAPACLREFLRPCERSSRRSQDEGEPVSGLACTGSGQGGRCTVCGRPGEQEGAAVRQLGPHAVCGGHRQCLPCHLHARQQGDLPPHGEQLAQVCRAPPAHSSSQDMPASMAALYPDGRASCHCFNFVRGCTVGTHMSVMVSLSDADSPPGWGRTPLRGSSGGCWESCTRACPAAATCQQTASACAPPTCLRCAMC